MANANRPAPYQPDPNQPDPAHEAVRQWAQQRTAFLDPPPGWQPDASAALARFHARMLREPSAAGSLAHAWRNWLLWAAAAVLLVAALLLLPGPRALAQQLWQFLTVKQVAFIRVKSWPEDIPSPHIRSIGIPIPPQTVRDVDEARWRVNYVPRLPRPGVLSSMPQLYTTGPVAAGMTVRAADLQLALRRTGMADQTVPAQWDGAQVALHTGPIVIAEWPEIVLVQSPPLTLTAPPGFDFPAYSALVLSVLGVGPEEAKELARRMATVPAWLAPIDRDLENETTIEEVRLHTGPATLFVTPGQNGLAERVTVIWSVPDRVYLLTGRLSRGLTIAAADAIQ